MTHRPRAGAVRPGLRFAIATFALLTLVAACRDAVQAPEPEDPGIDREATARALFEEARKSEVPTKVKVLKRLVALYHDTAMAPQAYFDLCFYLGDLERGDEALRYLETFAERHPDEASVANAFALADAYEARANDPDGRRPRIQEKWRAFTEAWRAAHEKAASGDRVAVWSSSIELAKRQVAYAEVARLAGELAGWAADGSEWTAGDRRLMKVAAYDRGCALGALGEKAEGLAAFRTALAMTADGVRGHTEQEIRALMDELERSGKLSVAR